MIKRKVGIIILLLLLIGLALAYLFLNTLNDFKITDDAYYHVNGVEYEINSGDRLTILDDSTLQYNNTELGEKTYNLPIYYRDSYKILLPTKMVYHQPNFNAKIKKYKMKQLTEIEYNPSLLNVTISRDGNHASEQKGFLFDGKNTYVFLENFYLTYNDKTIILPALSYVVVEYDAWVQAYDSQNDLYYYEDIKGPVMASALDNTYKVNLSNDIINYSSNDLVLISSLDVFKDYFTGERS